ncbi:MAG: HEPN domain-containing protein [Pseudomonadota bacterium]
MKSTFPEKSKEHESRIKEISEIIVNAAKDKIAFVILFGSFARGSWVFDRYSEDGVLYEYASDYDFLVITKTGKQANSSCAFDLERKILNEIEKSTSIREKHHTHIIIEPITRVNDDLEKSQYFFSDIKKEGILLYDSGEFELSEAGNLDEEERRKIAKADYEHWIGNVSTRLEDFYSNFKKSDEGQKYLCKAAFELHQATESLYNCALLTLTSYKPKSHDLKELNKLCSIQSNDFLTIFPQATEEQKQCFKLLQKAYIDARYNKNYNITKEQLNYLISRVEKLKRLVEEVCKNKI